MRSFTRTDTRPGRGRVHERAPGAALFAPGRPDGVEPPPLVEGRTGAAAGVDWDAIAPTSAYARWGHGLLDLVLLALVLPFALALMVPIALANLGVQRDLRRIFFVQERIGWRGRPFRMVKFRTMREVPGGAMDSWSRGHDHLRVTRFGRFLRNMHLDELPQLFNVLRGEMSFIGPRPEMVEIERWADERIPGFTRRLRVRPGLSGLAQVTQGYAGRSVEAYRRKLELSERYLAEMSLAGDLGILLRTALWMLRGRGWRWRDGCQDTSPGA